MFEEFELSMVDLGDVQLRVRHGGSGPALLLLHGHPQTHVMWHAVAPRLAAEFTVVCPDLRGYGDSSKPATDPDHTPYSKRAMARDQVALMEQLGFERFDVCGHDRGARCAYRLALDHPERVRRLAVLDIVPTGEAYRRADMAFELGFWHWAGRGELGRWYDVLAIWRDWADDVRGRALDCGHYLAEEASHETADELRACFAK